MRESTLLFRESNRLTTALIVLGIVTAAALAVLVPSRGLTILVWALVPIGLIILLKQPIWGVYLIAITIPLERLVTLEGDVSFTRVLGIVVFALWAGRNVLTPESWRPLFSNRITQLSVLFLGFSVASIGWAVYPEDTYSPLFSLFQQILWVLLLIDMIDSSQRVSALVRALLLAGLVTALLTVEQYLTGQVSVTGRAGAGITGGVNSTAMIIVTLMPLAIFFARNAGDPRWKALGFLYLGLGAAAVLTTGSRTSFVLMSLLLFFEYRRVLSKRILATAILMIFLVAIGFYFVSEERVAERLSTTGIELLANLAAFSETGGDEQVGERGYLMRVGLAIFRDYPFVGSGFENYRRLYLEYQHTIPGASYIYTTPVSPHSSYIGILANLGVIGLAIWLILLGNGYRLYKQAIALLAETGSKWDLGIARSIWVCFVLQLGFGWARPIEREKIFWLLIGMAVVLWELAKHRSESVMEGERNGSEDWATIGSSG